MVHQQTNLIQDHLHIDLVYGEVTTLILNAPNKASLRTTIPMFIVKQWQLKADDKLDWSLQKQERMKSLQFLEWRK